jgi:hypothetical protein
MKKYLPFILVGAAIILAGAYFGMQSRLPVLPAEQTNEEAAAQVEQTETPKEAGQLTVVETDQDFAATSETDFGADGLTNDALGL